MFRREANMHAGSCSDNFKQNHARLVSVESSDINEKLKNFLLSALSSPFCTQNRNLVL